MDLVSIIIPVYNREKMIQEVIKSCFSQSYENSEIIVVNDGSIDKTSITVEQMQSYSPKIKLINQENQGVSKARMTGLKFANGDYVMFLDSGDLISKDYISLLVNNI